MSGYTLHVFSLQSFRISLAADFVVNIHNFLTGNIGSVAYLLNPCALTLAKVGYFELPCLSLSLSLCVCVCERRTRKSSNLQLELAWPHVGLCG